MEEVALTNDVEEAREGIRTACPPTLPPSICRSTRVSFLTGPFSTMPSAHLDDAPSQPFEPMAAMDLPCDGDGVCMICKTKPTDAASLICTLCSTMEAAAAAGGKAGRAAMEEGGFQIVHGKKQKQGFLDGNADSEGSDVKAALRDTKITLAGFHIHTIPKPQEEYHILVSNTNKPFDHVWLEKREDGSFIHPLDMLSVTDFVNINSTDEKPVEPPSLESTPFEFVEAIADLKKLASKLDGIGEFTVDLEHNQYRSFLGLICLMHISTRTEDFEVDTLKLRVHIRIYGWLYAVSDRLKPPSKTNNNNSPTFGNNFDLLAEQNRGTRTNNNNTNNSKTATWVTTGASDPILVVVSSTTATAGAEYGAPVAAFGDAKAVIIRRDIHKSIKYNVWASTPNSNRRLDAVFPDAQEKASEKGGVQCPIFLFFSVHASGQFCGVVEMAGRVDFSKTMDFWQQNKWNGYFPVRWHMTKESTRLSVDRILCCRLIKLMEDLYVLHLGCHRIVLGDQCLKKLEPIVLQCTGIG